MNHKKITETLVHNVCVEGILPSGEIQRHVASCRSCLDTLASISELIKPGSSLSWYESLNEHYLCDEIEAELDLIAAKSSEDLASGSPAITAHLRACALCAERYVSAQRLLEAESEGALGKAIRFPERKAALWSEVKGKVFELSQAIRVTLRADSMGFMPFDSDVLPGRLVAEPSAATRSRHMNAGDGVVQEATIELMPPTTADKLIVRLLYETEGLLSLEFANESCSTERLIIALFETGETPSLIEARSLSGTQPVVRFERLAVDDYFIEIRGHSGVSKLPLCLKREGE